MYASCVRTAAVALSFFSVDRVGQYVNTWLEAIAAYRPRTLRQESSCRIPGTAAALVVLLLVRIINKLPKYVLLPRVGGVPPAENRGLLHGTIPVVNTAVGPNIVNDISGLPYPVRRTNMLPCVIPLAIVSDTVMGTGVTGNMFVLRTGSILIVYQVRHRDIIIPYLVPGTWYY